MRKALKFLHTLASCGMIGGLSGYAAVLLYSPQDTASRYADMRQTIETLSNSILLPSMIVALVTGLLSMAVHPPFQDTRGVWVKALMGLSLFEATLVVVQTKATDGADVSQEIAAGRAAPDALLAVLAGEWETLFVIMALLVANVALGVWRPSLKRR